MGGGEEEMPVVSIMSLISRAAWTWILGFGFAVI